MSKIRGSFATYKSENGQPIVDLQILAETLLDWGNTPKNITDIRAQELALLAMDYLKLTEKVEE